MKRSKVIKFTLFINLPCQFLIAIVANLYRFRSFARYNNRFWRTFGAKNPATIFTIILKWKVINSCLLVLKLHQISQLKSLKKFRLNISTTSRLKKPNSSAHPKHLPAIPWPSNINVYRIYRWKKNKKLTKSYCEINDLLEVVLVHLHYFEPRPFL